MQPIQKRLRALEAANQDDTLKLIVVEDGQTEEEAFRLAKLPANFRGVMFCNQLDVNL